MKRHSYRSRKAFILLAVCLFLGGFAARQTTAADPQSASARLVIHRIADLGNNLIVYVSIDGTPAVSIAYGHTYVGRLSPGRHVLSVMATPNARWKTPWQMTLDARAGQTYNFTAVRSGSGHLIL